MDRLILVLQLMESLKSRCNYNIRHQTIYSEKAYYIQMLILWEMLQAQCIKPHNSKNQTSQINLVLKLNDHRSVSFFQFYADFLTKTLIT